MLVLRSQLRMGQKTVDTDPVVDGHRDNPPFSKGLPVVALIDPHPGAEPSSVDVKSHGQPVLIRFRRRPDVQIQAVLAHRKADFVKLLLIKRSFFRLFLKADIGKCIGIPHALPWLRRLRFSPPQFAHRRRRIGNSLENADFVVAGIRAPQDSAFHFCYQ